MSREPRRRMFPKRQANPPMPLKSIRRWEEQSPENGCRLYASCGFQAYAWHHIYRDGGTSSFDPDTLIDIALWSLMTG